MTTGARVAGEAKTRARHLLRALLREATYLPDAAIRDFIRHRVVTRFRDYPAFRRVGGQRTSSILENGLKNLRQLERANNGDLQVLAQIFRHAYGRTGKRRYELMRPLVQDPVGTGHVAGETDAGVAELNTYGHPLRLPRPVSGPFRETVPGSGSEVLRFRVSRQYPLLKALVDSQAKQSEKLYPQRAIRSPSLRMPFHNLWLRVQPRVRQLHAAEKWYASILGKVLPPLPEDEWNELEQLALGDVRWPGAPPFRAPALGTFNKISKPGSKVSKTLETRRQPRPGRKSNNSQDYLEHQLLVKRISRNRLKPEEDVHEITPRVMRRLYANILLECPLLIYDKGGSEWRVHWVKGTPSKTRPETGGLVTDSPDASVTKDINSAEAASRQAMASLFGNTTGLDGRKSAVPI